MSSIAVAILNWNGLHHLKEFLPSVVINSAEANIYLIDNGSTDNAVEWVKQTYPVVSIVALDANYGFCEGYNKGLSSLSEEFFILLNSDVEVTAGWLIPLQQLLTSNANIAACQPKLLDYKNKTAFEYAGGAGGFIDYLGVPFCKGRILQSLEEDKGQYNTPMPIHWASGAAIMIRSSLFKQVGGFDSRFFAHMEEIDLCWRLRIMGFQIYSCPQSIVYHLGGGTLNKSNPRKTFLNVRNNLMMLSKNLPASKSWRILFQKLLFDGLAGIVFLFQGKWKDTLAIIKGHFAFYTMGKPKKEHGANESGKMEAYLMHKQYSIVYKYYRSHIKFFQDLPV